MFVENSEYASAFRRTTATMIDIFITIIIRLLTLFILGVVWINHMTQKFMQDLQNKFGSDIKSLSPSDPQYIEFMSNHPLLYSVIIAWIIVILVGALYHALLNSSSWQGTVGKRLLGIMIVNDENHTKISFKKAFAHYFLSVLPAIYVIYIVIFQALHQITLYQAITAGFINIFFGMIFILWVQIHAFTKKRITAYDMICRTVFINGRTDFKYPLLEFQLKKYAKNN